MEFSIEGGFCFTSSTTHLLYFAPPYLFLISLPIFCCCIYPLEIMSHYALSALLAVAGLSSVLAEADPSVSTPLVDKNFTYPDQIVSPVVGVHIIDR